MALKAKKPEIEIKEKRLKMFVYGQAGVGKTTGVIQFPNSYIIDTERGTDFYSGTISKNNSVVLNTLNSDEIKEELHSLLTEKHPFKTLIIDPITQVYNSTQEKWTKVFEKYTKSEKDAQLQDFGMRYWAKVKGDFKGLQRLMFNLDMNVIITSHQKDVYGTGFNKVGVTFDSMRGDDYFFDLVFRVERRNGVLIAITEKERAEIGKNKFPAEFEWSYANFLKFYGQQIIEKEAVPVSMADEKQVNRIKELIEIVNIENDTIDKWFVKAEVNDWQDMTAEQIQKCIDFLEKKVEGIVNKNLEKSIKKSKEERSKK